MASVPMSPSRLYSLFLLVGMAGVHSGHQVSLPYFLSQGLELTIQKGRLTSQPQASPALPCPPQRRITDIYRCAQLFVRILGV